MADELCAALAAATNGEIVSRRAEIAFGDRHRLDLLLSLRVGDSSAELAIETVRNAYPRDVQAAIWRLNEYQLSSPDRTDVIPLVAAESLSPGAREMLRKRGIGYFERNGNLYLRYGSWLVNIEKPEREAAKRGVTSLFTDAREMVVHALLVNRNKWLTGGELAEVSQTSQYTCSVVLQELERREWSESSGSGRTLRRRLSRPRALLDNWAEHWKNRRDERTRWYCFVDQPKLLLSRLTCEIDRAGVSFPWAFTGTSAANVFAPLLTGTDTADIVVPPGRAKEMAKTLGLKPAEKGANVTLIERDGTSLQFRNVHPEFPSYFASPFILYLDLLDGRGRNKELAENVLAQLDL
ncbi:hypothetical protein EVC45_43120 [Paraburkholderia sp. UYCP14C]|uniref:type IV toxin-antitoxin system AbiEi family antitoxin n=1 Tax=Paraburkholderia sp. UYCP14C TaxID=2511130 RepID=UPI001020B11D|nr:type IV toxin-antitoxin system AbiEi family antitoxin [Paraburkholderia sp. UYCP14C]RZF23658.1 hypothetical protein EVC45_43120 [Paraburkholderia sp. UYCP14C]